MRTSAGLSVAVLLLAFFVVSCGGGDSSEPDPAPVMTHEDFEVMGTQVGDIPVALYATSDECRMCHGDFDIPNEPYATWAGSLMANAGRDPLFLAQLATANQDVPGVGYYCLRCHVPLSILTGHADQADGSTLDSYDRDGVSCHLCHGMLDPIYDVATSPPEDEPILSQMPLVPAWYGNAMFVLDPFGTRRGPRTDTLASHSVIPSKFHQSGAFCGTCHDVGNVALTRQPDGTYAFNPEGQPAKDQDPHSQFPLERTYTEWKLSSFANGGVDMGGVFGGSGDPVIRTCQDCHMPRTTGSACFWAPPRTDLRSHEFAGAAEWVLSIIPMAFAWDPAVNLQALAIGRMKAVAMLQRAGTIELTQQGLDLLVRVINQTGHKIPTGHIEGRRMWVNVRFFDASDFMIAERGAYDPATAELDGTTTRIYEMEIGISARQSGITGLPQGTTTHMSLADVIVKDTRIPPRGFSNAAFEAAGAPVVGVTYADGQYWDDQVFAIPSGAVRAEAKFYYQVVTPHYIEALRDGNVTNDWGTVLHALWLLTDKAPPTLVASGSLTLTP